MRYLFLILSLSLTTRAVGQISKTDSSYVQEAKKQAISLYERTIYTQAHVYEGNEYITHDHRIKIHPFYRVDSLQAGTIAYNGVKYHDVAMLYDIVRDELAIQAPEGGYRIRLRSEKVTQFSLGSRQFNRIEGDSATGVPTGFYEVLHTGKTKALAHRIKTIHEDISSGSYQADYLLKDRFFIVKEGVYHEVKTKRSLLSLFPEQTKTLRKYIRTNKLNFKDDQREEAITRLAQHYDALTN
ncbi:hypothetical protein [Spirosoma areae]